MLGLFRKMFSTEQNNQLTKAIRDGALLVDVRTPAEFAAASVSGAINVPLDKIQQHLHKFKNQKSIVVFCRSGNRSDIAKSILEQHHIPNVINGGSLQHVNKACYG